MEPGGQKAPSVAAAGAGAEAGDPSSAAPAAVLDTNVALDWLLFAEPAVAPLAAAIESGAVTWFACAHMREEFSLVLRYPALERWRPDSTALLERFDRHARLLPPPPADPLLRCADGDDQAFIDLSRAHHARWLITRDRALLRLARRATPLGLAILTPARWAALAGSADGRFSRTASSP